MRALLATTAALAAFAGHGVARAADVQIIHAVARVVVIPEARSDVSVSVVRSNARLPLRISRFGDRIVVDGGLAMRPHSCHSQFGRRGVMIWGVGDISYDDMPQLAIRVPLNVNVSAGDTVFGAIGRSNSLDLHTSGCGDWTVADVAGPMKISVAGSGDTRTGSAGSADLHISGSGDIFTRDIRGGLDAATAGSGDIEAASIHGLLRVHVSGSGDVRAHGGEVTDMQVSVAGSGDVSFAGVARTLEASVAGSGDISVGRVTGEVTKHIAGSGDVRIGS